MDRWMDGCGDGGIDGFKEGLMVGWTKVRKDGRRNKCVER